MRVVWILLLCGAAWSAPSNARPHTLWGIRWQPGLEAARAAAAKKNRRKPVLWLRMLGDLAGKS